MNTWDDKKKKLYRVIMGKMVLNIMVVSRRFECSVTCQWPSDWVKLMINDTGR